MQDTCHLMGGKSNKCNSLSLVYMRKTFILTSSCLQSSMKSKLQFYSLSIGAKKTSEVGLVLLHLYSGTGFPALDVHVRVTFPFSTGFPVTEHLGTAGGTEEKHRSCQRFWVCCHSQQHIFIQTLKFRHLILFPHPSLQERPQRD